MKILSKFSAGGVPLTLALLSAAASAQEAKIAPVPRAMADIKTPAPVLPAKEAGPIRTPVPIEVVRAQAQRKLPAPLTGALPTSAPDATYFDQPGDGSTWSMGRTFKAQFSPQGASYIPNFGPHAPRNCPLGFQLASVDVGGVPIEFASTVPATRVGDSVQYERGGLTELYAIRADSVEQEFVFQSLPASGDLVVRMQVSGEFASATTSEGLRFSNELGCVNYGKAVAIDAKGSRVEVQTTLEGGSLEIRVPAEFVAGAALPLVIDPVLTTFSIDNSIDVDSSPDVAFDASTTRYLVCWERAFSATDHDVWAQQYDSNGALIAGSGAYIDFTGAFWSDPRVANNNIANNYEVVATVGSAAPHAIWGRARDSSSTFMNAQVAISSDPTHDCIDPDVGGDPVLSGPTYYMVIWERGYSSTDTDIHGQVLDGNGNPFGGLVLIDNSSATLDSEPAISKADGTAPFSTQNWTVTWTRQFSYGIDYDIWGAQILWDGSITHASYAIDVGLAYDYDSQASTLLDGAVGERDYMVVYNRYDLVSDNDLHGRVYNATFLLADADLSALDTAVGQNQIRPAIDSDGANYTVAYSEQFSTSTFDYDMYVSTFTRVGFSILCSEAHRLLDYSLLQDILPSVASQYGAGGSGIRSMIVWENYDAGGTNVDISGGIYENAEFTTFCSPGYDAIACPCGNPPSGSNRGCNNSSNTGGAQLTATGHVSLSNDTIVFTSSGEKPTATSIFLQGATPSLAGVYFGQGVRCASGTLKRLYVKTASGGVSSAPTAGNADVHTRSAALGDPIAAGSNRYYVVYYRDPTVLGGCSASSTFNVTQTLAASWIP